MKAQDNQITNIGSFDGVRVMPSPLYLVEYVDNVTNEKETKLAIVAGNQVRFLESGFSKPAQEWLRDKVLIAAGLKDPSDRKVKQL